VRVAVSVGTGVSVTVGVLVAGMEVLVTAWG